MFINTLLEHDRPMFAKQKITFTPQVRALIHTLKVIIFYNLRSCFCLVPSSAYVYIIWTNNAGSHKQHTVEIGHPNT